MSQNQIGEFIQRLRKEKGLTQRELGNRINVSDKTISKWENSNSIPDTAILPDLCKALDISVNELLYGEKLPPEDYSEKAEENIMNLLQEEQKSRKSEIGKVILGSILLIAVFLADTKMIRADVTWYLDIWSLLVPTCIFVAVVLLSGARGKKEILEILHKTAIPVGLTVSLVSAISVFGHLTQQEYLGHNLAIAMLSLLYTAVVDMVVCILQSRIYK